MTSSPTSRFSDRVADYVRWRPGYPPEVVELLQRTCGWGSESEIADIGSGTGILTKPLLETGARVIGIEPNAPMREAAEALLADGARFTSIDGTAEATTLPDASVDGIVAAQAFHWFDRAATRREIARILRPEGGWVALIWNERLTDSSPFLTAYEDLLLAHATDYAQVNHANIGLAEIEVFLAPAKVQVTEFANAQHLDFEGLRGRVLSCSYVPAEGLPGHAEILAGLRALFDRWNTGGKVAFEYRTKVYLGRLADRE